MTGQKENKRGYTYRDRASQKINQKTLGKVKDFEAKYGKLNRSSLYGKVNDMELLEWEGELETLERLNKKLRSLEEITFEYK